MDINLKQLGITKEKLTKLVVDQICDKLMKNENVGDEGEYWYGESKFKEALDDQIRERVEAHIKAIAKKEVLPNVDKYIDALTLEKTNQWGERTGGKFTFIEYLVDRAQAYMKEEVDYNGKSKDKAGGYSWTGQTTRIAYMVDKHLYYSVETAMKEALEKANKSITGGLEKAMKMSLGHVVKGLKVTVAYKR